MGISNVGSGSGSSPNPLTGALTATSSVAATNATSPNDSLGKMDFLKLLMAQLSNQDPMNPTDDSQFVAQMAQYQTLEAMQNMSSSIDSLVSMQSLSQASSLLGKYVETKGTKPDGSDAAKGMVSGASLQNGVAMLTVGDQTVKLSDVITVMSESPSASQQSSPASDSASSSASGGAPSTTAGSSNASG